jgi:hypothetical protein
LGDGRSAGNADFEFRTAKCGLLGTDLAAFPDYAHRAARSIHPRVGSRGSAAALRCNTRRSVAWSLIQAPRARSHSRSPFGTRRSASGESRYEYERPFCRHYSALPDLPFTNGKAQGAWRIARRSGILELPELSRLPRHATGLRVRGQRSEVGGQNWAIKPNGDVAHWLRSFPLFGAPGLRKVEHAARHFCELGDRSWEVGDRRSAKIFLAVRRALSPASGTRNKTSPTADAFFERTASLNGRSSRKKCLSAFIPLIPRKSAMSLCIVRPPRNTFRI